MVVYYKYQEKQQKDCKVKLNFVELSINDLEELIRPKTNDDPNGRGAKVFKKALKELMEAEGDEEDQK